MKEREAKPQVWIALPGNYPADWRVSRISGGIHPMYCNYCGKVIPDDAELCAYCGKRVAGTVARKRLVRPRTGRKIAGVCQGFSEYFDLDVALVRIVWVLCSVFGLAGVIAYVAAWIVVPEEPLRLAAPGAERVAASK
jgi:phage shock protein C